jgi:signal transduction histidine kinase
MRSWFRGKFGGLALFGVIAALVAGGLAWVTVEALRLEEEKWRERAEAANKLQVHLALWNLDSRIAPFLTREEDRPYNHFSAVYAPSLALQPTGKNYASGTVLELSPLVSAELPDWVTLHFQVDAERGWNSPQVLSPLMNKRLAEVLGTNTNKKQQQAVMPCDRSAALKQLAEHVKPDVLFSSLNDFDEPPRRENTALVLANPVVAQQAQAPSAQPQAPNAPQTFNQRGYQMAQGQQQLDQQKIDPEFLSRAGASSKLKQDLNANNRVDNETPDVALANTLGNGERWFSFNPKRAPASEQVAVGLGSMVPVWLTGDDGVERLVIARLVHIGDKQVCQGLLLDWARLQEHLKREVADRFPEAQFVPARQGFLPEKSERAMSVLPVEMDPGPLHLPEIPAWTPMRVGLALAWSAALVALLAVCLGGWTLLELSERRIRFVSAVTHELRTPLTTLRLYLDMLTGGIVQDEKQKSEYLHTLHTETERLNRLVGNVLDFSRLENQRPRLEMTTVVVADLLEQVREAWQSRCDGCDKLLIVDDKTPVGRTLTTDLRLVPQVLGNLVDNACKYSAGAQDRRIWLRATTEGRKIVFEVEDRGPGVAQGERRSIFRAFRRGHGTDTTGGVGLGLALAQRWARLLGGSLTLRPVTQGACFRLELPAK